MPLLVVRLHDLVKQKNFLTQMIDYSNRDLALAKDLLKKLTPQRVPKSILKNGKRKVLQQSDSSSTEDESHSSYGRASSKLRSCVIVIICANRLRNLAVT